MNRIEKNIYDILKSKPWLKYLVRNIYQSAFDLLPQKKEFSVNNIDSCENYFFGFHDITPFSSDSSRLLANHLTIDSLRMPNKQEKLEIGFFKFDSGSLGNFNKVSESFAWNYHKGCRLQWIKDSTLIFNTSINNKLISKTIDIHSLEEKCIDFPIDTVSKNGKWGTSFSYERLQVLMPGYGYEYPDEGYLRENVPTKTGLFLIDLDKNTRNLLVSLYDLASQINDNSYKIFDYRHYVTHTEFSPDNKFISFLHRWIGNDIRERKTRLVIYDLVNRKISVAPTEGMVSHYVWNNKNQIIAYCSIENIDCHVLFNVPNLKNYKKIIPQKINSDGHQSFINNTEFVTDTYPDKYRMAKLYKVNIDNEKVELLASLLSPKKFQTKNFQKHIACDLHPRVSPNGQYVSFDAVRNNKRSFCVMKLP